MKIIGPCLFLLLLTGTVRAQVPLFRSPAAARAWGQARERNKQFQQAGEAYWQEAKLYEGRDPQAAEAERRRARRLLTDVALAVSEKVPTPASLPSATPPSFVRKASQGGGENAVLSSPSAPPSLRSPVSERGKGVGGLGLLEPPAGCLIGVLDETAGGRTGGADDFAARVGHPVAVAFNYAAYGDPFPMEWARRQAESGRLVQIAWEPGRGLSQVQNNDYLQRWASDASRCGTGVFLRFAGEMNGGWTAWGRDPDSYRSAFRLVAGVLHRTAPNVAMVWAPNAVPFAGVDRYYPGDDAVDWVGISLYMVRFYDDDLHRPAFADHPLGYIEPFYEKYARRKPFCLVECGVSRRSRVENADADGFAAARWEDLLSAVRVRFPRLRMLCFFDRNNLSGAVPGRRLNDYSLPPGSLALKAVQTALTDPYFLGSATGKPARVWRRVDTIPADYAGIVLASVSTYTLQPALLVTRGAHTQTVRRPFLWTVGPGAGTVRVQP